MSPEQGGAGLQRFLNSVSNGGVRRAVVFVPPRPGPWLDRVRAVAATGGVVYLPPELGEKWKSDPNSVMDTEFIYGSQGATRLDLVPLLAFEMKRTSSRYSRISLKPITTSAATTGTRHRQNRPSRSSARTCVRTPRSSSRSSRRINVT